MLRFFFPTQFQLLWKKKLEKQEIKDITTVSGRLLQHDAPRKVPVMSVYVLRKNIFAGMYYV